MSLKFFLQSKKSKKPTSDAAHIIKFCRSYKVVKAGLTVSVLEGFLILGYYTGGFRLLDTRLSAFPIIGADFRPPQIIN